MTRAVVIGCCVLAATGGVVAALAQRTPERMQGARESAQIRTVDDQPYVGSNDLSRLLGATRYWRADIRKLELRAQRHRMVFTVGNPFVVIDQQTVYAGAPVLTVDGEVHVPVVLIDTLGTFEGWPRLRRAGGGVITRMPPAGVIRTPVVSHESGVTRVVFPADAPDRMTLIDSSPDHFRLHFEGLFIGRLPVAAPEEGWLDTLRLIPTARGSTIEMQFDRSIRSYRVTSDRSNREIVLEVAASNRRLPRPIPAPERSGPRDLRVIVIDPGHGGLDVGARAGSVEEKAVTLQLAWRLREEIVARLPVRVVVTRGDDRTMSTEERATLANRVRADLVISVHFDAFASDVARGVTAYFAPATDRERDPASSTLREWRGASAVHATDSRDLAEAVLAAIEARGLGPTRSREVLPYPLIGVDAPGILLECATLSSESDLQRVTGEDGVRALATAIVDGLGAYARND